MSWHHAVSIDWTNEETAVRQQQINSETCVIANTGIFTIINTWTYTFFSFSRNTKKKLVHSIETWTLLCKNRSLAIKTLTRLCHPRNSWLSNKDITLNLHTADRSLFNNGHFTYNYEWKCKNNVVSMKSNYLICRMQHYILIETIKRYMTQIENSLTVPCWHHVWREKHCG